MLMGWPAYHGIVRGKLGHSVCHATIIGWANIRSVFTISGPQFSYTFCIKNILLLNFF